tara:strand:+ start:217 stop:765 length:549 start_codon:yes stop_codon:yes gene_type:complete
MFKLFVTLLCVLLDSTPKDNIIIKDTSDVVEINHVYSKNENGAISQRLVQVIWWNWKSPLLVPERDELGKYTGNSYRDSGFVVMDFRVTVASYALPEFKKKITPRRFGKKWVCEFYDKQKDCFREVTSKWLIVSHTLYDREMNNQVIIENSSRKRLTNPDRYDRIGRISQEVEDLLDRNTTP